MINAGGDVGEPGWARADDPFADWIAEVGDQIAAGKPVDLTTLAAESPEGVEELRKLIPAMEMMARLRPKQAPADGKGALDGSASNLLGPMPSLGDFRTVGVIGRGGMGVVYEAVQISLNRRVALKILPVTSADDPRKVKRFQIEAQAAALLNDPHIVPVYTVGSENGVHFYAMQLIEGQTLAQLMNEKWTGASARLAADLGRQAALALDHAHEQGIIHRDIKPSNLLIESSGWLWVADFGLARIAAEADQTSTGAMMGTPRYMSPEQVTGPRKVVDHRTDIYSLGATLYELLTLRPAFESDDRLELIVKIAHDEPRRPRHIDPSIPRDLETIVLKAMAKDPAGRYASGRDLADDLGRFLEGRPIFARRPSATDRAAKWVRRHRPAVAATAVFLLATAIGLGGAILWRDGVIGRHNSQLAAALVHTEQNASSTRRLLYDSQMRLAQQSSASGQVEFAQELLAKSRPEPNQRDSRGFEWHYLWRACRRDVSLLARHETAISATALSPDGRALVSADFDGIMIIWDMVGGRERSRFHGHDHEISGLSFSPSGRMLASTTAVRGVPSEVKLWDSVTSRQLSRLPGITGHVSDWAFSADGRVLITCEHDLNHDAAKCKVVFWNLSQVPVHPAPGAEPIVCDRMAYSSDGRWLATGSLSGQTVTLRDAATGQPIKTLSKRFAGIAGIFFSPDGHTLAVQSEGITLWDMVSGRELGVLPHAWARSAFSPDGNRLAGVTLNRDAIQLIKDVRTNPRAVPLENSSGQDLCIAFSPDGKALAGGGTGLPATLWDSSTGRRLVRWSGKTGAVKCPVFAAGGDSLIFASEDGQVRSWHFNKGTEPIAQLPGHPKEVWALAYTPDGATVLSAGDDHSIKLWDARDGRLQSTFVGHDALVTSLAVNAAGTRLASASFDKTVRVWLIPGGNPGPVLRGHTDRVRAVVFSPDEKTLASAGSDKTVRLWNAETGDPIWAFSGHTDTVRALAFDPSGSLLVSSSDDRTIHVMTLKEGLKSFSVACPKHNSSLAFSPDGAILAAGDDAGTVTFWDVATWSRRTSGKGADATIWSLAFSPDGRTLAAACGDAKVRLWDPISGQVLLVLDGHLERVNAVAFSPDGQTLASADHKGEIKLWQAAPRAEDPILRQSP